MLIPPKAQVEKGDRSPISHFKLNHVSLALRLIFALALFFCVAKTATLHSKPLPSGIIRPPTFSGENVAGPDGHCSIRLMPGDEIPDHWIIDWGDGKTSSLNGDARTATHDYLDLGAYKVQVRAENKKVIPAFLDYGAHVLNSQPTAYFRFSEADGGQAVDQIGGMSGTLCGDATQARESASPNLGAALHLTGNGYVTIPSSFQQVSDAFSIEFWAKFNGRDGRQTVFSGNGRNRKGNPSVYFDGTSLCFELSQVGVMPCELGKPPGDGQWHHYAISYERVFVFPRNSRVRFYGDGKLLLMKSFDVNDAGAVSYEGATLGASLGANGQLVNQLAGELDELALYKTELLPGHIQQRAKAAQTLPGSFWITVSKAGSKPFTVEQPVIKETVHVLLDPNPSADNQPVLSSKIAAAKPGTRLLLCDKNTGKPGGTFYCRSKAMNDKNGDGILIPVIDKSDLEIDGGGALLIFSNVLNKDFLVKNCTRVAIRNLKVDIDQNFSRVAFWARILKVDPSSRTLTVRTVKGVDKSPDSVPDNLSWWRWRPHHPETFRIVDGPSFNNKEYDGKPIRDSKDPSVWQLKLKPKSDEALWKQLAEFQEGNNFFMVNNASFSNSAFSGADNHHVTLDHLSFHAVLRMVCLFGGTDHLWIKHCRIAPPDGLTVADRPLVSGADGYHFHSCPGYFLFEDNEICLTDDDPISIKSSFYGHMEKVNEHTLQNANKVGKDMIPGVEVELRNPDLSPTGYRSRVEACDKTADGWRITLDKPLPDTAAKGLFLNNLSRNSDNWILRNNYFHDYYGRVMLYTPGGTVENNRFVGTLFRIGTTAAQWETAGVADHILIRNNLFYDTLVAAQLWSFKTPYPIFEAIVFRDNSVVGNTAKRLGVGPPELKSNGQPPRKPGVTFNNTKNTIILGNFFEQTTMAPDGISPITMENSKDVQVLENQ